MTILHSAWMLQCYRTPLSSSSSSYKTKLLSNFNNTRLLWPSSSLNNNNQLRSQARRSLGSSCAASTADAETEDTFYAEQGVSWSSLGLSDKLSRALANAGFHRPSLVQAASVPKILSGKDVVVGAETGSGKTHSYLVPLMDRLSRAQLDSENASSDQYHDSAILQGLSLVLCPNVLLCEQVVQMANCLCGDDGKPLLKVAAVCGGQGWPVDEPNIVVSTPAALLNCIDPKRQRRLNFVRAVKYVVFDEADMLICGSFHNQVIRLINMFRFDEKQLSWSKEAVLKNSAESNSNLLSNDTSDNEEELRSEFTLKGEEYFEGDVDHNDERAEKDADSVKSKYERRVRRKYDRSKQYIFVAATLPINGKKTAGAILKHMFPDALWVSGNYLHCHNPRLEQRWVEVSVNTQVDALIKAVKEGFSSRVLDYGAGVSRTMIFANTVEAVEAVSKILQTADIECYRYHKDCSLTERAKTIVDFREKGGILVCTDAAARGVDVPNVSHVIQADFATSAVDFLHRVGRTARAGQYGLVTSLYTESNRDLVTAVRQAAERSEPVETAFSRKRGFRNKIKKRGSGGIKDASSVEECVTA